MDANGISMVDQLTTTIRIVLLERGYNAEVGIATFIDGDMQFDIKANGDLPQEVIESVIAESVKRIGGKWEGTSCDN
jgi:hypothetical protein